MKNKQMMLAALALALLVSVGCKKMETMDQYPATGDTNSPSTATNVWQKTKETTSNAWESVKEGTTNAWANTKEASTNAWANVKEGTTNAWAHTKEATITAWADIKDSLDGTKDYAYDRKDAFVTSASADLDALDEKIKELSDKVANTSGSVKADAQVKLQELRDKRDALNPKWDAVKNATEAGWDDAKTAFKNSYDDVKASVKDAWQWLGDKLSS